MPRAGLTPERVLAEARIAADELGWDALTLQSVATRVGVKLPSLYKHVASLAALRSRVAASALDDLASALERAAVGRSGREALEAVAWAYRDFARAHPGLYAATLTAPSAGDAPHVEAAARTLEVVSAALRGYGLDADALVHAVRSVRAALHGFASLEAAGGFGMPTDVDDSYRTLVAWLASSLESAPV